jgi:hypothetical protein
MACVAPKVARALTMPLQVRNLKSMSHKHFPGPIAGFVEVWRRALPRLDRPYM